MAAGDKGYPDLEELRKYTYQTHAISPSDEELEETLQAEIELQARRCRVPAVNPETELPFSLKQALKRRVARNLVLRAQPGGVIVGIADGAVGMSRVSGEDREIDRLEMPYRKMGAVG